MTKSRLEAFSDGVIAIVITVMVLELKVPRGEGLEALRVLAAPFAAYVLSFLHVGLYWNNHHHLLAVTEHVNGKILWANLNFLFWLSLMPVTTAWMGATHLAPVPTALYGLDLFLAGCAYFVLGRVLVHSHGKDSPLARRIGSDTKGKVSTGIYAVAFSLAGFSPRVAAFLYVLVALVWFVPDRRLEASG
ncbi:MAG: Integral rane protein [Labilithrix sp.]|nr:Integral rane protein [Labilithrix sp.]